jgi:hypothetical protein
VRITRLRAKTVEIPFTSRATSTSSDKLVAIIPEPITAATKMAVPRNSANKTLKFIFVLTVSYLLVLRIAQLVQSFD